MDKLALGLTAVLAVLALHDWKRGFALCALLALLQDPLRKLVPGQPVYFVVLVGVVFGAAWLGALQAGVRLSPAVIHGWRRSVGPAFKAFVLVVVLQAVHSFVRFGSPVLTGIGLMAYLAPVFALVLSYQFALRRGIVGIRRLYQAYATMALLWLTTVYLQYLGVDWAVLGEVGAGIWIYDVGTVLQAYSGFFRASEIAAWHAATVACLTFLVLVGRRLTVNRLVVGLAAVAFIVGVGILTGRRKMLVEIVVFLSVYYGLLLLFDHGRVKVAMTALAVGLAAFLVVGTGFVLSSDVERGVGPMGGERYRLYALRGQSVMDDISERFQQLGIAPVMWAVNRYGIFGAGLGTGSQGTQHFTGGISRGAAEGGLGKITMELGLPGLAIVLWFILAFARHVWKLLVSLSRTSPLHARWAYGLVGYLVANAAAFSVATQAYGDLFVLLMLGWATGFLLAMPALAAHRLEPRRGPTPAPRFSGGGSRALAR